MASAANRGFMSNAGFVVTRDGVVVFDALGTPALGARHGRTRSARSPTQPIRRVVVSHYHADHVYGLAPLKAAGAEIWAHRRALDYFTSGSAAERLAQRRADLFPWVDETTELVKPDVLVDGDTAFRLGGTSFRILDTGGAHAPDDIMLLVEDERLLFAGDLLFAGRIPFVGNADSKRWLAAIERLIPLAPAVVVPGPRTGVARRRARPCDHARLPRLPARDDGTRRTGSRALRRRVREDRLVALSRAAGVRAGQPHQRMGHLPADGAGSARRREQVMADVPMIGDPVLAVAVRAARRAASVVVDAARDLKRLPTFSKEHLEIASSAGDEARSAMVATIGAAFPEHEILGRDARAQGEPTDPSPYKWIVEPIDGGANFAHGYPHYAVTIALAHGTEVTHATVLDPMHDELFTAVRGKGAQLNGAPIRVSACTRLEDALVGTVFPARGSGKMAALPAAHERRDEALRGPAARGRRVARPRVPRGRPPRRLLRDEPQARRHRRGRRCWSRKPAVASAISPAASSSCAPAR